MACVCDARYISESFKQHSYTCEIYNQNLIRASSLINEQLDRENKALKKLLNDFIDEAFKYDQMRIKAFKDKIKWETQDKPCSGSGFAHKPHGACDGYGTDRT